MTAEAQPRLRRRDKRTANRSRHYAQRRAAAEQQGRRETAEAAFDQLRAAILDLPADDQERAWDDLTADLDAHRLRHAQ